MNLLVLVIYLLWSASACMGQEPVAEPLEGQDPIAEPLKTGEDAGSRAGQAFADDVFQSRRNHYGFSLGAYQAYTTDISTGDQPQEGSGITAFVPRTFINLGKRKSRFHLDAAAGYRNYNGHRDVNSWDYYGDAQYSYQFSKRTFFQIANQFASSFNDSWGFVSLYSPINYSLNFSNEVLFERQRITRNALKSELDYQISRKSHLAVFGGYDIYQYAQEDLRNTDAIEVGGSFDYQLTKWLYFSTGYSSYLNNVDARYQDARIHHLQIGGFDLRLTRSWRLWVGGGIEIADYQGGNHVGESISGGIGYTSGKANYNFSYQHGFTSTIGFPSLLESDIARTDLGYRITNYVRARLWSDYYRSSNKSYGGLLKTFTGGGELEFALRRNLSLTLNGYYQNQQEQNFFVEGLGLNRFAAFAGLQYIWPSRRSAN